MNSNESVYNFLFFPPKAGIHYRFSVSYVSLSPGCNIGTYTVRLYPGCNFNVTAPRFLAAFCVSPYKRRPTEKWGNVNFYKCRRMHWASNVSPYKRCRTKKSSNVSPYKPRRTRWAGNVSTDTWKNAQKARFISSAVQQLSSLSPFVYKGKPGGAKCEAVLYYYIKTNSRLPMNRLTAV